MAEVKRLLLVRLDGLGDAIACVPALEALRRSDVDMQFGAVCSSANACLFSDRVARVHVLKPDGGFDELISDIGAQRYTHALVATEQPLGYRIAKLSGARLRAGFWHGLEKPLKSLWQHSQLTHPVYRPAAPSKKPEHEVEALYRLACALGAGRPVPREPSALASWLRIEGAPSRLTSDTLLGVQVTSKLGSRGWGPAALAHFIANALQASGMRRCVLLCAPGETQLAEALLRQATPELYLSHRMRLLPPSALPRWLGLIASLDALITPDTGAAHAAGMLGTPVVDLFEPANFGRLARQWSPWAAPSHCLVKPGWEAGVEVAFGLEVGRSVAALCAGSSGAAVRESGEIASGRRLRKTEGRSAAAKPRVLAVCVGGGAGDLLAATPAMLALQRRFETGISVLTSPYAGPILEGHPAVDDILIDDGAVSSRDLARTLARRRYTHAVVFWSDARSASLVHGAGIGVRVGQTRRLYSWRYTHRVGVRTERGDTHSHWTDVQMDYARALGAVAREEDYRIIINLSAGDFEAASSAMVRHDIPRDFLALHAARGIARPAGRWPAARFAELGDALYEAFAAPVVLTGAADEAPLIGAIASAMRSPAISIAGGTTLRSLAALLARARVVVALDSGPMHIAAAVGAPTVGVFALRTDLPDRWRPLGVNTALVRPSYPCPRWHRKENCPDFACYAALSIDEVKRAARRVAQGGMARQSRAQPMISAADERSRG